MQLYYCYTFIGLIVEENIILIHIQYVCLVAFRELGEGLFYVMHAA